MNLTLWCKEDYMWKHKKEDKDYIVMFNDNTVDILACKDNEFYRKTDNSIINFEQDVKGFIEKDRLTFSVGFYSDEINDYKFGEK